MWQVKNRHTGEVFQAFDSKAEFDLQPEQLVTAGCIFRGVGLHTHEVVEAPESGARAAARESAAAKVRRAERVAQISVTTAAGNTFDGDETSQTRMARAILVLGTGFASTIPWVLADNTIAEVSAPELTEALALAGQAQTLLWVL